MINNAVQVGGGGSHCRATMYEGLSKTDTLVWQREEEVKKIFKFVWHPVHSNLIQLALLVSDDVKQYDWKNIKTALIEYKATAQNLLNNFD